MTESHIFHMAQRASLSNFHNMETYLQWAPCHYFYINKSLFYEEKKFRQKVDLNLRLSLISSKKGRESDRLNYFYSTLHPTLFKFMARNINKNFSNHIVLAIKHVQMAMFLFNYIIIFVFRTRPKMLLSCFTKVLHGWCVVIQQDYIPSKKIQIPQKRATEQGREREHERGSQQMSKWLQGFVLTQVYDWILERRKNPCPNFPPLSNLTFAQKTQIYRKNTPPPPYPL